MGELSADSGQERSEADFVIPEVSPEGLSSILDLAAGKLVEAEQPSHVARLSSRYEAFRKEKLQFEVDNIIRTLDKVLPISEETSWGHKIHELTSRKLAELQPEPQPEAQPDVEP